MSKKRPEKTSIQISDSFWRFLNNKKTKPNESFEEVLLRMLESKIYENEVTENDRSQN